VKLPVKKIEKAREKNSLRNSWSPLPVAACKWYLLLGYELWNNCWALTAKMLPGQTPDSGGLLHLAGSQSATLLLKSACFYLVFCV